MYLKELLAKFRGRYWLIAGALMYLGTTVSSIIRSIAPIALEDNIIIAIEWIAACVIYFFLGALFGLIIDFIVAKCKRKKFIMPFWAYLALLFWFGGSVLLFLSGSLMSPALIIFFPWAYGIFFIGSAFVVMMPDLIIKSLYGKVVFDIVFILLSGYWLCLELRINSTRDVIRKVILLLLFLVLTIGYVGCARFLS